MSNILILMATYNGEKYLREQLDSIINQTYTQWDLLIQDDDSNDGTKELIKEYAQKDKRITWQINTSNSHGAFENFHLLINSSKKLDDYDYYMFSDQDDIWNPNKIQILMEQISAVDNGRPAICYADMTTIDENGNVIDKSINKAWGIDNITKRSVFFSHKVFGCNMIMNNALFRKVDSVDINDDIIHYLAHDEHYTKCAGVYGEILYYPKPTMRYRRHESNTTGEQKYHVSLGRFFYRVTHLGDLAKRHCNVYNQSLYTISVLKRKKLTKEQRRLILQTEYALKKGGIRALKYIDKYSIVWGSRLENISRRLIILLGLYKKYLVY